MAAEKDSMTLEPEHSCDKPSSGPPKVFRDPKTNEEISCVCGALQKLKALDLVYYNTEVVKRGSTYYVFREPKAPKKSFDPDLIHCKFYLRNACTKADCEFRHDPAKLKEVADFHNRKARYTWFAPNWANLVFTNSKIKKVEAEGAVDWKDLAKEAKAAAEKKEMAKEAAGKKTLAEEIGGQAGGSKAEKAQPEVATTSTSATKVKPGREFSYDWADDEDEISPRQ